MLREPIDSERRLLLRQAVVDHLRSVSGRAFPAVVHLGVPGGVVRRFTISTAEPTDLALRTDIVAAMLERRPDPPWLWLTRMGRLDLHDLDAEWLAAATAAYAEAGVDLTMVVVNRRGWRDPRSGVGHTWVRLRV